MNFLIDTGDALGTIDCFLIEHAQDLSADTKERILAASRKVSSVDKIVGVAEALYADRDDLGAAGLTLGAQLAEFATRYAWHGLGENGRGAGMILAFRRLGGDVDGAPDPAGDPPSLFERAPTLAPYIPPAS